MKVQSNLELKKTIVGALPIINAVIEKIKLREFFTAFLKNERYADSLIGLIISVLIDRRALYRIQDWSINFDSRFLSSSSLPDHTVARALDRLAEIDQASLTTKIFLEAASNYDITTDVVHNDSTTFKAYGAYESQSSKGAKLKHGYSKDKRPDLKQLLYNLCITSDGAIPLYFRTYDGNQADATTHWDTWKSVQGTLQRSDFLYIADCKLCTDDNLDRIDKAGGRFITVVPRNRNEIKLFYREAADSRVRWSHLLKRKSPRHPEKYDVVEIAEGLYQLDKGYRVYWYRSSEKRRRDCSRREDAIAKARSALKRLEQPTSRGPKTAKKMEEMAKVILRKSNADQWLSFKINEEEVADYKKIGKGRSSEDSTYRKFSKKKFSLTVQTKHEAILQSKAIDGTFPLVNNSNLGAREVYLHYKKQSYIEKRFSLAKSDLRMAPIFLKSNERINSLAGIYFFSQMIAALVERELRKSMVEKKIEQLPLLSEGRPTKTPTWEQVNRLFEYVSKSVLYQKGIEVQTFKDNLSSEQIKVLELLKINPEYFF
jgi:transposase